MQTRVERLRADNTRDFFRFQCPENGNGWCHCVAWWLPTWEGWGERTAEQNRQLREDLFARGEHDGYLLYVDDKVSGWCQVGQRDRLEKLTKQFGLSPEPEVWAITCFELAPAIRGKGLARELLTRVLEDLRSGGVQRVQAFPKRGTGHEAGEVWTGPESLFTGAQFKPVLDDGKRLVMELDLQSGAP